MMGSGDPQEGLTKNLSVTRLLMTIHYINYYGLIVGGCDAFLYSTSR